MNKSIIHIGFPRCASTFLQVKYFPYVKKMLYLGKPHKNEFNLAMKELNYLDSEPYLDSKAPEVLKKYLKNKPFIISNEGISLEENGTVITQDPAIIASRLKEVFGDSTILIIIRNQLSWIESFYLRKSQRYFYGETLKTPNEWVLKHYQSPGHGVLGRIDYFKVYKAFSKVFTNVEVIPFEELREDSDLFLKKLSNIVNEKVIIKNKNSINERTTKLTIWAGYVHRLIIPGLIFLPLKFLPIRYKKMLIKLLNRGPKAKVVFPKKFKYLLSEIYSEGNNNLNKVKNLNLEKYNYFL